MIIMAANSAGIAGSQVFRTEDAPLYIHAFTACLILSAVSIVEIILQSVWYASSNKSLDKEDRSQHVIEAVTDTTADGHTEALVRTWWWTW